MSKLRRIAVVLVAIMALLCLQIGMVGCKKDKTKNAFFSDETAQTFTFDGDKALEEDLTIERAVSFDLQGYALDLNGYTLTVESQESGCLVEFKDGTVKNGKLAVSVPNGDVEFNETELADDVDYELEAASETIRFANAKVMGKGIVKSNTHVQMDFSELGDITLEGNGSLEAGEGVTLQKLNVGTSASGAKINISKFAAVADMAIAAKAEVKIAGSVSSVTVDKDATDASGIEVKVEPTATVEKVQLDAPAKVDVKGEIKNVTVSETANNDGKKVEVKVASTAKVQSIDLQAKTSLEVKGAVGNMVVGDKAEGTSVTVKGADAAVGRVVVNAENTKVAASTNSTVAQVVVSKAVEEKVSVSSSVNKVVEENVENLVKSHTYTLTSTVEATCSTFGKEIYTCSDCGDSYHTPLPKTAHDYKKTVTQQATQVKAGIITYTCEDCGASYTEHVAALDFTSESIAALIALVIEDGSYSLTAEEGSAITLYDVWEDYTEETGYKTIFIINMAEAAVSVDDGVIKGTVKFEGGMTKLPYKGEGSIEDLGKDLEYAEMENLFSLYAYIDGDGIVYELDVQIPGDYSATDFDVFGSVSPNFVADLILGNMSGSNNGDDYEKPGYEEPSNSANNLTVGKLFEIMEMGKKFQTIMAEYKPFFDRIEEEIDFAMSNVMTVEELIALVGDKGFTQTKEGENTKYTFTTKAIEDFADSLKTDTLKDLIDRKNGEGTFDNLVVSIKGLPKMTVKEILGLAAKFEEEYNFSIEKTIGVLEMVASEVSGEEIEIMSMIEALYDYTIIDIVYQTMGGEQNGATKAELETMIGQMIDQYAGMVEVTTIDEWLAMAMNNLPTFGGGSDNNGGNANKPYEQGVGGGEPQQMPAVSDMIKGLAMQFGEMLQITFTCDKDGKLILMASEVAVTLPPMEDGADPMQMTVTIAYAFADGVYTVNADLSGYVIAASYDTATGTAVATLTMGETTYTATVTDGETGISGMISAMDDVIGSFITEKVEKPVKDQTKLVNVLKQFSITKLSVKGYDVEVSYDKDTEAARIIVNQNKSEFMSAIYSTDNGVHTLTLTAEGKELGEIVFTDEEIKNGSFTTEVKSYTGETQELYSTATITVNFEKVDGEENVYKLNYVVETEYADKSERYHDDDRIEQDIILSFDEEVIDEMAQEINTTISVGVTVVVTEGTLNYGEPETVYDGTQSLTIMQKGGEYLGVKVNYDFRMEGMFATDHKVSVDEEFGNDLDKPENENDVYMDIKLGFNVNFKEENEVDDSDVSNVTDKIDAAGTVKYNADDATITYVKDGSDEYYAVTARYKTNNIYPRYEYDPNKGEEVLMGYSGRLYTEEYYAEIPAVDGVPTYGFLMMEEDCGDWYKFMLQAYSNASYTYTVIEGWFDLTDSGYVPAGDNETKVVNENTYYNFDIQGYFNAETGEGAKESHHNYVYTCVEKNGKDCSGGLTVTRTCDGCQAEDVYTTTGCYFVQKTEYVTTNVCGTMEIEHRYCVNCTESHYNYGNEYYNSHNFHEFEAFPEGEGDDVSYHCSKDMTQTDFNYVTSKIKVIGDMYYGSIYAKNCVYCGLEHYHYDFYTHSSEDGLCRNYMFNEFVYDGTTTHPADYAYGYDMDYSHHSDAEGLYYRRGAVSGDEGYEESASAWSIISAEVIKAFGKIPFSDYRSGEVTTWHCEGCEKVTSQEIDLHRESHDYTLEIDKEYYYNGDYCGMHAWVGYAPEYVAERVADYIPANLSGSMPTNGEMRIVLNKNDVVTELHAELYYNNNDMLYVDMPMYSNGRVYAEFYDYSECKQFTTVYDKDGNVVDSYDMDKHDYSYVFEGTCCTEDGIRVYACRSCKHKPEGNGEKLNYHNHTSWSSGWHKDVTQSSQLNNHYVYGERCYDCGKVRNLEITLEEDLTLTDNLFIYGEYVNIDLNGYTLDLNGYNLIVYGFAGSDVQIYDSYGDRGEPNVINSNQEGNGVLLLFADSRLAYDGDAEVTIGYGAYVDESVTYCTWDDDNLKTIETSFYEIFQKNLAGFHTVPSR